MSSMLLKGVVTEIHYIFENRVGDHFISCHMSLNGYIGFLFG